VVDFQCPHLKLTDSPATADLAARVSDYFKRAENSFAVVQSDCVGNRETP
jgi:hypothetical protein